MVAQYKELRQRSSGGLGAILGTYINAYKVMLKDTLDAASFH